MSQLVISRQRQDVPKNHDEKLRACRLDFCDRNAGLFWLRVPAVPREGKIISRISKGSECGV